VEKQAQISSPQSTGFDDASSLEELAAQHGVTAISDFDSLLGKPSGDNEPADEFLTAPYSRNMEATYENFVAECPHCESRNIFNRASDLRTFQPILLRTVECEACHHPFKIGNDSANAAHEMLLYACFAFIERKEYMQCALSVAEAYEVFFRHFLYVQLVYRPFAIDGSHRLPELEDLMKLLYERVRQLPFGAMREVFLRLVVDKVAPVSIADAKAKIASLPGNSRSAWSVPQKDIHAVPDEGLKGLLLRLQDVTANELRNDVVHKDAKRPTRNEAVRAHDEAREILHGLTVRLGLGYDVNWYMAKARRAGSQAKPSSFLA
jgi:hypothetical protein